MEWIRNSKAPEFSDFQMPQIYWKNLYRKSQFGMYKLLAEQQTRHKYHIKNFFEWETISLALNSTESTLWWRWHRIRKNSYFRWIKWLMNNNNVTWKIIYKFRNNQYRAQNLLLVSFIFVYEWLIYINFLTLVFSFVNFTIFHPKVIFIRIFTVQMVSS